MMRSLLSRFARNDKGATAVEFAIILPVLLLFVFGIIEWGLYMYNRQVITNAAREGARYGILMRAAPRIVNDENEAIRNKVLEYTGTYLVTFGDDELNKDNVDDKVNVFRGNPPFDETYTLPEKPFKFGTNLTVQFNYEYGFLMLPFEIDILGTATMKME